MQMSYINYCMIFLNILTDSFKKRKKTSIIYDIPLIFFINVKRFVQDTKRLFSSIFSHVVML